MSTGFIIKAMVSVWGLALLVAVIIAASLRALRVI